MTLDEMKTLYIHTMGYLLEDGAAIAASTAVFTLRVWDGMDGVWCDVVANVDLGFALREWCKHTKDGTEHTKFDDIDYYKIFPADTKLMYSGGYMMFRGDEESDDE